VVVATRILFMQAGRVMLGGQALNSLAHKPLLISCFSRLESCVVCVLVFFLDVQQ
jgi:hypothetical protein